MTICRSLNSNSEMDIAAAGSRANLAAANRKTDGRDRPNAGGSGETFHDFAAREDGAGSEKADSGYDLSGYSRRIENDMLVSQDVGESVLRNDHDQARPDAYQHMRTDARGPQQPFAFQSDHASQHGGTDQANKHFGVGHFTPASLGRFKQMVRYATVTAPSPEFGVAAKAAPIAGS